MVVHTGKPKFRSAELWGACSRCNARVRYSTLRRERLTGLLVCSETSGRPVRPCWDPWPEFYDFQVKPDRSIEPPAEPLPLRYNLDDIWGAGPSTGTTRTFANAPKPAPDDATRLQRLLTSVPHYEMQGKSAAFNYQGLPTTLEALTVTRIDAAAYDGTFIPSSSLRTVTPPDPNEQLEDTNTTDKDFPQDPLVAPPWAQAKRV